MQPANHWKLGLFVVGTFVLGVLVVVLLGAQSLQKQTTSYKTYFDESVQGLEVGSPVKFRGVTLGNVSRIDIAADHRLVEVTSELQVKEIRRLKLSNEVGKRARLNVSSDLRIQLDSAGITGVKYLLLDFFPEADNPPPPLPFPPPENYIPAAVSMLKGLQGQVVRALTRLPEVTDAAILTLSRVAKIADHLDEGGLPQRAAATFDRADRVLAVAATTLLALQRTLGDLETKKLSADARATMASLTSATGKLDALLGQMSAEQGGLQKSMQRATDSVVEVARSTSGAGAELQSTLRAVREAAASVQKLADALETDSDMLVKGRARRSP